MGFILFIVAIILTSILSMASFVFTPIYYIVTFKWKSGLGQLDKWFLRLAVSLDQFGNTSCSKVLEYTMTKRFGVPFGDSDMTVSYVLGRNKYRGSLTLFGKLIVWILHLIDTNHVEKAIEFQKENDRVAKERFDSDNYYG